MLLLGAAGVALIGTKKHLTRLSPENYQSVS